MATCQRRPPAPTPRHYMSGTCLSRSLPCFHWTHRPTRSTSCHSARRSVGLGPPLCYQLHRAGRGFFPTIRHHLESVQKVVRISIKVQGSTYVNDWGVSWQFPMSVSVRRLQRALWLRRTVIDASTARLHLRNIQSSPNRQTA